MPREVGLGRLEPQVPFVVQDDETEQLPRESSDDPLQVTEESSVVIVVDDVPARIAAGMPSEIAPSNLMRSRHAIALR